MSERERLLLRRADELVLGWRNSEWTGIAPFLEEDVAFSSMRRTRSVTPGRCTSSSPRRWAGPPTSSHSTGHRRYRHSRLVELRLVPDWARTLSRGVVYEAADASRLQALKASDDPDVAGLAAKIDREEAYHQLHAQMWQHRLAGEPRFAEALDELRPARGARPARRGVQRPLGRDDDGAPLGRGCDMVTEAQVWDALAEIPDPEIPVISLVELGVVRDVAVEDGRVRVEFTPTFLGCPALEVMRDQMAAKVRELGGEPEVAVISDDSWSTDRITPEGREKLRAAFAPACAARNRAGRSSSSSRPAHSAAPTAARRTEARTSSARRRAARCATATAAGSRSSSSRRSRGPIPHCAFAVGERLAVENRGGEA